MKHQNTRKGSQLLKWITITDVKSFHVDIFITDTIAEHIIIVHDTSTRVCLNRIPQNH